MKNVLYSVMEAISGICSINTFVIVIKLVV